MIRKKIKNISFVEKFSQMIMIGLDIYDINDEIIELIEKYKIGGVILYKKNYTSLDTMIEVVNKLKKINSGNEHPLFIAIDQENGRVNRFPKEIARIYSAEKQARTENMQIINLINEITTYLLKEIGINMNFAPVLDINKDKKSKIFGNRCYGKNKEDVIKYGLSFMRCMQKNNIVSVIKHFPGYGAINKERKLRMSVIKDEDSLLENDIEPFQRAIKENVDAIMVGHLKIKGYGLKPATTNKRIIKELLQDKYNYNGIIISDDLRIGILKHIVGIKKRISNAVEAGNDIIIVKYKKGDMSKVYKKLFKMIRNYEIDIEKINNSYKKIINLKKKYKINDKEINNNIKIDLINKKIKEVNRIIDKEIGV